MQTSAPVKGHWTDFKGFAPLMVFSSILCHIKLGGSEAQAYFLERPLLPVEEEGAFLLAVSRLPHPGLQHLPHLLQVLLAEQGQGGCQFLRGQVPPPEGQEQLGELRVKPGLQGPGQGLPPARV